MAKQKNTENKKLHSKLLGQKKNNKQAAKELNKQRLRELNQLANKLRREDNTKIQDHQDRTLEGSGKDCTTKIL